MIGKRPRHYAQNLLDAPSDAIRKSIYQDIPEHYKELVLAHYNNAMNKRKYSGTT